jgi:hypothetical protein
VRIEGLGLLVKVSTEGGVNRCICRILMVNSNPSRCDPLMRSCGNVCEANDRHGRWIMSNPYKGEEYADTQQKGAGTAGETGPTLSVAEKWNSMKTADLNGIWKVFEPLHAEAIQSVLRASKFLAKLPPLHAFQDRQTDSTYRVNPCKLRWT